MIFLFFSEVISRIHLKFPRLEQIFGSRCFHFSLVFFMYFSSCTQVSTIIKVSISKSSDANINSIVQSCARIKHLKEQQIRFCEWFFLFLFLFPSWRCGLCLCPFYFILFYFILFYFILFIFISLSSPKLGKRKKERKGKERKGKERKGKERKGKERERICFKTFSKKVR